ncbi:TonB-linked outer membrane protein, SusC/RagA family [Zunongwangia mangrovi]|uniref:TonB-linked outer membrane protein, SusC/RagA family n=1 Tax=Zunongwangia mangrovi TaxID=1334022 RepID=A0A1I1EGP6_9FLAO|nr:SusC/RagA family TonB-linked outer membrane protein [Zunongwangia mangrovi]SFB86344.1 TonB-linked outer membrane protein, SusC/RagA family [Zunongwangia mangrovi]
MLQETNSHPLPLMFKQKIHILFLMLFISGANLFAQNQITGKIIDNNGMPLLGATVAVRGTNNGTQSDMDGNFTLQVANPQDAILVISYVGFSTKEVPINGKNSIEITLEEDSEALSEVVVTALGIKSEKRALGYATAEVDGDNLSNVKATNNFVNALSGKVAGVQISSSSSQPGSGARIVIRGGSSITGNNQPLLVVNGVPFDAANGSSSSGLADIDPNSIESLSVLKGAAASALYGSEAANGVILVTTKSGTFNMKPVITLSSSVSFDDIYEIPLQDQWSQGYWENDDWVYIDGNSSFTSTSFGPRISEVPGAELYDRWDIFETGITNENSLSITGGGDKASYYVSYSNLINNGILSPLEFRRNSINANTSFKFTPKLTVSSNILYTTQKNERLFEDSSNSSFMNTLMSTPNTWNPYPIYAEDGSLRSYRGGSRDPYTWVLDNVGANNERDRFAGTFIIEYEVLDNLKFRSVTGISTTSAHSDSFYNLGGYASVQGSYSSSERFSRDIESTETITYDNDFGDFEVNAMIGHNIQENKWRGNYFNGNGLILPNIYNSANVSGYSAYDDRGMFRSYSFFGQAMIGYKKMLYYTVTGRNDWASSLADSFFYPSHSLGLVFTELFPKNDILNFGKLRASYAKVGSPAGAYARNNPLVSAGGDGVMWPFNGQQSYLSSARIPNPNLTNEFKSEVELGLELRTLKSRLNFDIAYYHNWSENQILSEQFLASTGYTYGSVNIGGITHKGVEVGINATPIQSEFFNWDLSLNWSKDNSNVDRLGTNNEPISVGSYGYAIVDQPYPVIFGLGFLRDDQGRLVLDDTPGLSYGRPLADNRGNQILGQTAPEWISSLRNTFNYKNLSLMFQFDMSRGGNLYSLNDHYLTYYGMAEHQNDRPDNNMTTFDGVMGHYDSATGEVVVTSETPEPTRYDLYYQTVAQSVLEDNIMPKDYIKLREVQLAYNLPNKIVASAGLQDVQIAFSGRNLWRSFHDDFEGPDPEINTDGITNGNGYLSYSLPTTKTYSITLTAKF